MSVQMYATVRQIEHDLLDRGDRFEDQTEIDSIFDAIEAASRWIVGKCGKFQPVTETRWFDGHGTKLLILHGRPLLSTAPTITNNGTTLATTDYILYGLGSREPKWENGPFISVQVDPDASALTIWKNERDVVSIAGDWGKYSRSVSTGATATLADASTTTMSVDSDRVVSPGAVLLIEAERLLVKRPLASSEAAGVATLRFEVERGVNGTSGLAHASKAVSIVKPPADVNYLTKQIATLMKKKADADYAGRVGDVEAGEIFYTNEFPKRQYKEILDLYRIQTS